MHDRKAPGAHSARTRDGRNALWPVALLFACAALLSAHILRAQISPGPLARAHQSLDGPANCIKCHEVSTKAPTFRCLDCHREIAAELQQNRGLHATFPRSGLAGAACVKCHSDHNGVDFQMLHWNPTPQGFDHAKTGFELDGKHSGVGCRTCHAAQHISPSARSGLGSKDLSRTWMGLSSSCSTCHADKHQGRFGNDCARCHNTTDWKAASFDPKNFDHSKTQFPLTGAHRYTMCKSCHMPGSDGQPRYEGLHFESCSACHLDPHKGSFKQGCNSCHNTSTWKKSQFAERFDHTKTNFPLLGKHTEVSCLACHKGGDFKAPIAHAQCADCHKPDPHGGQFAQRPDGGRCESCHTVQGWSPSTFVLADHAKTKFPLAFPHQSVACASCHVPAGKQTRFKLAFARCVDCHKDEHEGQFASAPWNNRCEQCHNEATFKTAAFSLAMHQKSPFPLTGGHTAVACNECHKPAAGTKVTLYHFANLSCTTCHEDVHRGQFAQRMAGHGTGGRVLGCEACHTTKAWSDVARFDHSHTRFPLVGSHRAVACAECHRPPNLERTMMHVDFAKTPVNCGDCHENPHADQFGARGGNCAACHNSNKWRPSLFNHDTTLFALKGGHENVACSACHMLRKEVNGAMVLFYKPTPTHCEDCHQGTAPKPHAALNMNESSSNTREISALPLDPHAEPL